MEELLIGTALCLGLFSMLELTFFAVLAPSLYTRLPFKQKVDIPMPDTDEALLVVEASADTLDGTWRYYPHLRSLLFRRKFTLGRRPYSMGCIRFDEEGRATMRWAPFPLLTFPLLVLAAPFLGAAIWYQTGQLIPVIAPLVIFPLMTALNWAMSRQHFFSVLLPQIEGSWMERQQGR
mgnify:CR=1 FL=1